MAIRGGFLSFPKVLNNFRVLGATFDGALPIDSLITNLFETAYVHPWVSKSHLRWFVSDFVIRRVLWCLTGTQAGCNQWAGELPPERQGRAYVFLNKSAKAMPFINRPYFKLSRFHRMFAHYIDPPPPAGVKDPTIYVVPFPDRFDKSGRAIFPPPPPHRRKEVGWKQECRPDLVVLCTGYKQQWGWLGEGYPRGPEECDVRGICSSRDLSVAFVGFLRPGVGAIPSMAEQQIQLWLLLTTGKVPVPTTPETYHLLHSPTSRIQYGVDYSTYMAQLARDMGSSPSLRELWEQYGWFVMFVYWWVHSPSALGCVSA
jgi:dimethylaniline monooxygenase (N-oxide forming)